MKGFGQNKKNSSPSRKAVVASRDLQGLVDQGLSFHQRGDLLNAERSYILAIQCGCLHHGVFLNLGAVYQNTGRAEKAIQMYQKSIELYPNNVNALSNLGIIYSGLGLYDNALKATLAAIKLDPKNASAIQNLKGFADQLVLGPSNLEELMQAFSVLLDLSDFSHSRLSIIFLSRYLPEVKEALKSYPIISDKNIALARLAADQQFLKSLKLFVPPQQEVEVFLTQIRKELIYLVSDGGFVPSYIIPLLQSLSVQCFLNEYVYFQHEKEIKLLHDLLNSLRRNCPNAEHALLVLSCYKSVYELRHSDHISDDIFSRLAISDDIWEIQYEEPAEEAEIRLSIQSSGQIADKISLAVGAMYEENPYPRYRYSDYVTPNQREELSQVIKRELARNDIQFSSVLNNNHSALNILIAGCGTGKQVIQASRYKNTSITAIDLSLSSLSYAMRKAREYKMENVNFARLDILSIYSLRQVFDMIECSGVLHHMESPKAGLSALNRHLKPGGCMKLALYSDLSRSEVINAREWIQQNEIQPSSKCIRDFRQEIFNGNLHNLSPLAGLWSDFYSLSECRDLCFHIQEHRFTIASLEALLKSENLVFLGFILPRRVKNAYLNQYPNDHELTCLENWAEFESKNPLTFVSMYQFWVHKPL